MAKKLIFCRALYNIKKSYNIVVQDFFEIQLDNNNFDAKTRAKAQDLEVWLRDPNFVSWLHFLLDLLNELVVWSKRLQKKEGLLITQHLIQEGVIRTIGLMGDLDGPFLLQPSLRSPTLFVS